MKLQALATVLLVFLICPDVQGQSEVSQWEQDVRGIMNELKRHMENVGDEWEPEMQQVLDKVKTLFQKGGEYTLEALIELLKEFNGLRLKIGSSANAEVKAMGPFLVKLIKKLEMKLKEELQMNYAKLQALVTTLDAKLRVEGEQLLAQAKEIQAWLETLFQKGGVVTREQLAKLQAAIYKLRRDIYKFRVKAFLSKLKARVQYLEGESKARVQQIITQLEEYVKNGRAFSEQELTKLRAAIIELIPVLDKATAAIFEGILKYLGLSQN